jgi:hypothetical protein
MRFEWDERKRLSNLAKHGLDFVRAVEVFDRPSFTYQSARPGEERWVTVGMANERLVAGSLDGAVWRHPRDLHERSEA